MTGLLSPRSTEVPDSRYGIRKAKMHAQSEANRLAHTVYLQFEPPAKVGGKLFASVTINGIRSMGAPFYTFYSQSPESEKGLTHSGQDFQKRGDSQL